MGVLKMKKLLILALFAVASISFNAEAFNWKSEYNWRIACGYLTLDYLSKAVLTLNQDKKLIFDNDAETNKIRLELEPILGKNHLLLKKIALDIAVFTLVGLLI